MASSAAPPSPFHPGECAIQERLGVRDKVEAAGGRVLRDYMLEQHRSFFAQLPFIVVGSVDAAGRPWASLVAAPPGFVQSPDEHTLVVRARPPAADPLSSSLAVGASLGLLGIELPTRRRNRANGTVVAVDAGGFRMRVEQSFGNCPKYIQRRTPRIVSAGAPAKAWTFESGGGLDPWSRRLIAAADTLFVASYVDLPHRGEKLDPPHGGEKRTVDVSHRGGKPGFVRVGDDGTLTIPDFVGNFLFNTLGNLLLNPRAGVVIADFGTGDMLFLSGVTEIVWNGPEVASFAGAQRLWRLRPVAGFGLRAALPLRAELEEVSPNLAGTGGWDRSVSQP
jgi:predicted pyridoxine 5'-phosphate oxidase superfamily flavin-nucleotide-binding protein